MASSREETLKSALFGKEAIRFEIPKYQRAYSWERDQWKQFLQDLKDAESGYYLGKYEPRRGKVKYENRAPDTPCNMNYRKPGACPKGNCRGYVRWVELG